jgi:predicted rRNA methylase YqxC with S4 and FtsJ domains
MNKLDSTLKLFNMLKTAERALKKEKDLVLLVQSSRMSKKKDKNNKGVVSKVNKLTRSIKKDKGICYHYGKEGYWRRNCHLATVKANKLNEASTLSMFIIKNYLTTLHCSSWYWLSNAVFTFIIAYRN